MENAFLAAMRLHQQGLLSQAEPVYRRILSKMPNHVDTLNALGMLLQQSGRADDALTMFRQAAALGKNKPHIQLNLAETLRVAGHLDDAQQSVRRALNLRPNYPEAWLCLANLKQDQGMLEEAVVLYQKAINGMPDLHAARNGLGVALHQLGQLDAAIEVFQNALRLNPNQGEVHLNLANTYFKLKNLPLAEKHYRICEKLLPDNKLINLNLVELMLESATNTREIEQRLQAAESDLSDSPYFKGLKAQFLSIQGVGSTEISDMLKSAFEHHPIPGSLVAYARINKFKVIDQWLLEAIRRWPEPEKLTAAEFGSLHFALGKMYDDLKQYDQAFEHFKIGNQAVAATLPYDREAEEAIVRNARSFFTQSFFDCHVEQGIDSIQPVFIVGMPRSGTTLVEQIISSHPQVFGGGELLGMIGVRNALSKQFAGKAEYPALLEMLSDEQISSIANQYLQELNRQFPGGHAHITDKLPHNFLNIGLITLLFPRASIVHVRREAMDNCLSLYTQQFSMGHAYAYDLSHIGHQYMLYEEMMAHWHDVLPGRVFDIQYEDLVSNMDEWARKLIDAIGLEWNENCLTPHQLARDVKTASLWQVRQPVYNTSVQRWKHYEKHLAPLKEALGLEKH